MKTIKIWVFLTAIALGHMIKAQTGEIRGLIKDDNYEPVIGALVKITAGGYLVGGTTTDANGKYVYKPLEAGEYDILVTSSLHSTVHLSRIPVKPNEVTYADVKMVVNTLTTVVIESTFIEPLVDATMIDIKSISAEEWTQSAIRTEGVVNVINSSYSGAVSDGEGKWHIHGARADATEYLVDGVKVSSANGIPNLAVENISLISGGIPAMYGDLTSGVMVITTKDYFSGMRYKRMRDREFEERQEFKRQQKIAKLEEENRKKEIEQEKLSEKAGK